MKKLVRKFFRKYFPVTYINWVVKHSDPDDFNDDAYEMQQRFKDLALLKRAAKMEIYLDEFPYPHDPSDPTTKPYTHWTSGHFERFLHNESRIALRKAVREREPVFSKNRREAIEFWFKWMPALTGLIGVTIGLVTAIKK